MFTSLFFLLLRFLRVGREPTRGNKRVTFIMQRAARTAAILRA
jgi:hypothetical protein